MIEVNGAVAKVEAFIQEHWKDSIRYSPEDRDTLIGLPFPYTVPCASDAFQELYYWDSYFTSVGLWHLGECEAVISNLRNLVYEVLRFGFVPNANRTTLLDRSQPPYLAPFVRLVRDSLQDDIRREVIEALRAEYSFWTELRGTQHGLSRYGHSSSRESLLKFYDDIADRAQLARGGEDVRILESAHTLAEAESGWDFTPRFQFRCMDFLPVDLNSLLYELEITIAELVDAESSEWNARAAQRAERIRNLMWDESRGAFFDVDWRTEARSSILSAATFQLLWVGIATAEQAAAIVKTSLPALEERFGIVACEKGPRTRSGQWDFPNIWPGLQLVAYRGLARYGYTEEAMRIARKYIACVVRAFEQTGNLWEKYDARTGDVQAEKFGGYKTPPMLGWTAGVFLDSLAFLKSVA